MDDLLDGEYGDERLDASMDLGEENLEESVISMEDAWVVIDSYFDEKGLVGQQIDSFDEFLQNTIQELVDDAGEIIVTPENQFIPGQDLAMVRVHPWLVLLLIACCKSLLVCTTTIVHCHALHAAPSASHLQYLHNCLSQDCREGSARIEGGTLRGSASRFPQYPAVSNLSPALTQSTSLRPRPFYCNTNS